MICVWNKSWRIYDWLYAWVIFQNMLERKDWTRTNVTNIWATYYMNSVRWRSLTTIWIIWEPNHLWSCTICVCNRFSFKLIYHMCIEIVGSLYRYVSPMVSTDPNANTAIHDLGYRHIYGRNRVDVPRCSMLTLDFVFNTYMGFRKLQIWTIVCVWGAW
jgi:hypothetical protein